jgi:hypothetical protein
MKILPHILLLISLSIEGASSFISSPQKGRLGIRSLVLFGDKEKNSRRERRTREEREEYQRRRNLWLGQYGSVEALQETFGVAPIFGDLNPEQTRRLYHTLLPRSLLGLYEMGLMKPEELAPLAFNARIAAKEYARSRCIWTGRLMTTAYDLYRGRLGKPSSMSWEELYKKYEAQIVKEECSDEWNDLPSEDNKSGDDDLTMRIYLRILERSCSTNQAFDSLFLTEDDDDDDYLNAIASKLENDVRFLLLSSNKQEKVEKVEKKLQKAEQKEFKKQQKLEKKETKRKGKRKKHREEERKAGDVEVTMANIKKNGIASVQESSGQEEGKSRRKWKILRILAGTRRRALPKKEKQKHY